jgi:hypothetical protein
MKVVTRDQIELAKPESEWVRYEDASEEMAIFKDEIKELTEKKARDKKAAILMAKDLGAAYSNLGYANKQIKELTERNRRVQYMRENELSNNDYYDLFPEQIVTKGNETNLDMEKVMDRTQDLLLKAVNQRASTEQQIKELTESKLALKIAFNGNLATEKAAYESRIKELQAQIQLNYCQPCYDKLNKHE